MLKLTSVNKSFSSERGTLAILKDINFEILKGQSLSIVGPSGSGKTTLLGICAGLDIVTSGTVELAGQNITVLSEDQRAKIRNQHVGFVFQNFQLLPTLTALENVMVPLELMHAKGAQERAKQLLDMVGLGSRITHYPTQLSGGEQQRVAIARAFSNSPKILFADEPTGNLDGETGDKVENLLFDLNKETGTTLVMVTHDTVLASKTDRVVRINSGVLHEDFSFNEEAKTTVS